MPRPRVYDSPEEANRAHNASRYQRRRAAGLCLQCDERPEVNPATGEPYVRCREHRRQFNARQNTGNPPGNPSYRK